MPLDSRIELRFVCGRFAKGRIEKNLRREAPGKRQKRNQSGYGVEHADSGLFPILIENGFEDEIVVMHQDRNIVVLPNANGVPAVVSDVEDQHVEIFDEK